MNEARLLTILRAPHISEKTSRMTGDISQYAFKVAPDAKKPEIKRAVEKLFNTKVKGVQICQVHQKSKTTRGISGAKKAWKKAYVTLEKGQQINIEKFEA